MPSQTWVVEVAREEGQENGRIGGGTGTGGIRKGGRKQDSQGGGNQGKLRKILQNCIMYYDENRTKRLELLWKQKGTMSIKNSGWRFSPPPPCSFPSLPPNTHTHTLSSAWQSRWQYLRAFELGLWLTRHDMCLITSSSITVYSRTLLYGRQVNRDTLIVRTVLSRRKAHTFFKKNNPLITDR